MSRETFKYFKLNENISVFGDTVKKVLRGTCIALNTCISKEQKKNQ